MNRRQLSTIALLAALAALSGCASLNQIGSEVSSYGQWPPGRAAGRYFIERLPSQAAQTPPTAQAGVAPAVPPLEAAAHGALQAAGFQRAPSLETADVVVQIGARVTRYDISPWADPLWWRWGPRYWRGPAWTGQRFYSTPPGWRTAPPPDREVHCCCVTGPPACPCGKPAPSPVASAPSWRSSRPCSRRPCPTFRTPSPSLTTFR
ncbi:MAG: hypothetical protein ACKPCJ_04960 [Betaproteobacteria bacterium]